MISVLIQHLLVLRGRVKLYINLSYCVTVYLRLEFLSISREDPSSLARKVKLSRTDSVRTQNSIQLLDENLTLIGTLKARGERCRYV